MRSISFAGDDEFDSKKCYQILTEIERLKGYFSKFNKGDVRVAMSEAFHHAMLHYDPNKGELTPYLKKLAREILKPDPRMLHNDFLEQTVSDEIERYGRRTTVITEAEVDTISEPDSVASEDAREQVVELALQNMNFFLIMCESLKRRDTSTKYFPKPFKASCLRLSKKIPNFASICLSIYEEYKDAFTEFIGIPDKGVEWRELDAGLIQKLTSKRVKFQMADNPDIPCTDPDTQPWVVKGALSGKRIIKVPYRGIYDYMMELIDSDVTNPVKFCIDDSYVFRTLGGSLSCVNSSLFTQYDIFLAEVITNLLYDLSARYLMTGSECLYFLAPSVKAGTHEKPSIPDRVIRGVELKFNSYDVTPDEFA